MALYKDYGYTLVEQGISVEDDTDDFYTRIIPIQGYTRLLVTYDITVAFTGGSSPGLAFTIEGNVSGDSENPEWVELTTLVTTDNGYESAAPSDPTITSTGKDYKYYSGLVGTDIRIKVSVSGSPTGGTATIENIHLLGK